MTTGMMGNDEGLLTEQDVAGVLEVSLSTCVREERVLGREGGGRAEGGEGEQAGSPKT